MDCIVFAVFPTFLKKKKLHWSRIKTETGKKTDLNDGCKRKENHKTQERGAGRKKVEEVTVQQKQELRTDLSLPAPIWRQNIGENKSKRRT